MIKPKFKKRRAKMPNKEELAIGRGCVMIKKGGKIILRE